jgi:glycosyltransferase involved in cell wall biosynthesis
MREGKTTIVFVIDFIATREGITGGTEKQLLETISRLDPLRFKAILVCLQQFQQVPHWEDLRIEKHVINVYSLLSSKALISLFSFARYLKANSVDIVQTFYLDSTLFGVFASRLAGIKRIISCRRDMGFWYDEKVIRRLRFTRPFTARILVNSNAVKHQIVRCEKVPEGSVDVIHNGIDLKAIDEAAAADLNREFAEVERNDAVVGIVANFNREVKRLDVFIRAAAEVCKYAENVKFVIIGGGRLERSLRDLVLDLGLEKFVVFGGKKDNAIPYIKSFDIGVITSDSEGFSNVILEYMGAGIPSVATEVGGNCELIENGNSGVLAPKGDYRAIANEILKLICDKERRIRIGKEGRRVVAKKYSWDVKIREIESYYHSLRAET